MSSVFEGPLEHWELHPWRKVEKLGSLETAWATAGWGYPHHFGQHQTHHFRQHSRKSHTPHTLDAHIGQHGFHHFGQHGKHRSYHSNYLTQPFRVWLGGWGRIILLASLLWLSHFHHDLMLSHLLLTLSSSRSWWRWRWIIPGRRKWLIVTRIMMMKWWWW